ncbi:isoleucine--tRNA ligase [Patescibacteria group bacterium]|nr:isoleucine--tRNA ligase [Patescibacteria group bacterium]
MFSEVKTLKSFAEIDNEILPYWEKNKIFKKTLAKNKGGKSFVFYEGPPTANGMPHLGHILPRVFKDLFPRYKTMQGYNCIRKGGWDTQGLPVELEVEKELGFSGKSQIEKYGVIAFNKKCRESVFKYVEKWNMLTQRIGYWLDLDDPYVTMDKNYIESVWWVIKTLYDKKLIVKDYKVLPYCARCETPLSSHELAQGYKETKDASVYVKFKVKNQDKTYFLAWTTTPWTLPGNVALAVSATASYVKVSVKDEFYILAKGRLSILNDEYTIIETFKGLDLVGIKYQPPFDYIKYDVPAHFVTSADFVTMEDGTGIVHTAVMYGVDDFELGSKIGLPKKHAVDLSGKFIADITPYAGMYVKKADKFIIEDLAKMGSLYKTEEITHDYPFCWRCDSPLLYYALESYFVKTTALKEEIIKENQKTNWYPKHLKNGRMGEWLSNMVDWSISRSRFWGTPIPIWVCAKCNQEKCLGSYQELPDKTIDPHRPYIDEIKFKCKCGGEMARVPYVLDCWFDSGAMPFAQYHFPFENKQVCFSRNKELFESQYPADFICEAIDQTRGWFYTLMVLGTLITGKNSYKTVLTTGHGLDEKGRKMSKSVGNVVDPFEALDKYGADIIRWNFFSGASLGNNFRTGMANFEEVRRQFFNILWNSFNYFVTYFNISGFKEAEIKQIKDSDLSILDKWIVSRIESVTNEVTKYLDKYDALNATKSIEGFVINDLSTWYIRRSRGNHTKSIYRVLYFVFKRLSIIMAPLAPFISEKIYQVLGGDAESVHLENWPRVNENYQDEKLEEEMRLARVFVEQIHAKRHEAGIKLRQPLAKAIIKGNNLKISLEIIKIIGEELNVKKIEVKQASKESIELDTVITKELELEGQFRDFIRSIQELRKSSNVAYDQIVAVTYEDTVGNREVVEKYKDEICKQALLSKLIPNESFKIL